MNTPTASTAPSSSSALAAVLTIGACAGAAAPAASPSPSSPPSASPSPSAPTDLPGGGGSSGDPGTGIGGAGRSGARRSGRRPGRSSSSRSPASSTRDRCRRATLEATVDGRRVLVKATWWSGVEPCNVLDSVKVERSGTDIAITLIEGTGDPNAICIEIAMQKATIVDLGELEPGDLHDQLARRRRDSGRPSPSADAAGAGRRVPYLAAQEPAPTFGAGSSILAAVNLFDLVVVVLLIVATGRRVPLRGPAADRRARSAPSPAACLAILALPHLEDTARRDRAVAPRVRRARRDPVQRRGRRGDRLGHRADGRGALGEGVFGELDRVLGAFVGRPRRSSIVWLTGGLLAAGPSPTLAAQAQTSFVVRALSGVPAGADRDRRRARPAPQRHRPAGSVRRPRAAPGRAGRPARRSARPSDSPRVAVPSVVKVTASTCDAVSLGTGFVVDRGYVVTNAHVVAGAKTDPGRRRATSVLDAVPVLFDPKLDVAAAVRAQLQGAGARPSRRPIRTAGRPARRSDFPGGGRLDVQPGRRRRRVRRRQGRDIYGKTTGHPVDPRDPGGDRAGRQRRSARPADGTIGGVVFAEARTDEEVGYALTPSSVRDAIRRPSARRQPSSRSLHPLIRTKIRAERSAPAAPEPAHDRRSPPPARTLVSRRSVAEDCPNAGSTRPPYGPPTDPAKRHSAALTDGPDRAGARAMLKAVGFTDEDLAKPLVGVATTWIETMPCNLNQRRLAEHVKAGIRRPAGRRWSSTRSRSATA